jgi:hypothetical protein
LCYDPFPHGSRRRAHDRFRERESLKLVVSVDVEEEGLFTGRYVPGDAPVSNVRRLLDLDPMFRDLGIRPTLLVTYQVARHSGHRAMLAEVAQRWKAEIGAHLHPWNTPPLDGSPQGELTPSEGVPQEVLAAKLQALGDALRPLCGQPLSFRMGRFDMGPRMFSVLERGRIRVDSSIAPLRKKPGGPDHLSAPVDPYYPSQGNPCSAGVSHVLEAPLTIVPLVPWLGAFLERLVGRRALPVSWISWFAMHLGSLPAQPAWTGLRRLKAAARLHKRRDGQVLTLFFHSSELLPGGSPGHLTQAQVDRFLGRLAAFLGWLIADLGLEPATLSEVRDLYPAQGALAAENAR